jgi:hypothetical protein
MELFFAGVLGICIGLIIGCPCLFGFAAISHALRMMDFAPFLVLTLVVLSFCVLPFIFLITSLLALSIGPSTTRVTLTFDGRVIKTRYGVGSANERTIYLSDVISIARHTARDEFGLRRIFGAFNPAKPGVLVKTAQKTYAINTDEFDKFAEVIKKYKPEVEISG